MSGEIENKIRSLARRARMTDLERGILDEQLRQDERIEDLETQDVPSIGGARFAWAFEFGLEGQGVIPAATRVGPIRVLDQITSVTLKLVSMMATVSGSITFKIMSAAFSTSSIPATEVSDSSSRPLITTAFAAEKTTFGGTWDVVWASGDELFIETVGAATTIEQVTVQLEGTIQP